MIGPTKRIPESGAKKSGATNRVQHPNRPNKKAFDPRSKAFPFVLLATMPRIVFYQANHLIIIKQIGAPGRIRTYDPLVRSQVLYPAELRALR